MSETKEQKALRYIAERRLLVSSIKGGTIIATCRGDSGEVYVLGFRSDERRWGCTCLAAAKFRNECAHLIALKMVTVKPKEE